MLRNYIKVIIRNMRNNKLYSGINVLGLSIAVAICLLASMYVINELSFDTFHKNIDSIYYMRSKIVFGNMSMQAGAQAPLAQQLKETFPEVEHAVRMKKEHRVVMAENRVFDLEGLATDPGFFSLFSFDIIHGRPEEILNQPDGILLTQDTALRLFGAADPLDKTLSVKIDDMFREFRIMGVTASVPDNSSLKYDFLIPLTAVQGKELENWNKNLALFIGLRNPGCAAGLAEKFPDTIDKYLGEDLAKGSGYSLFALKDFHLGGGLTSVLQKKSSIMYSYILGGIAMLVLLMACFNFTNLSIGNASKRLLEVGVRKVMGAQRKDLARQFMMESFVLSCIALIIGIMLSAALMPSFNMLSQKSMSMGHILSVNMLVFIILLPVVIMILSSWYPVLILSGFSAADLFRGKMKASGKHWMGRTLIVLQFAISIFLVSMTLFLFKQHRFLVKNPLGFEANHVMEISLKEVPKEAETNHQFFSRLKEELSQYPPIRNLSGSAYNMTADFWACTAPRLKGDEARFLVDLNYIAPDFIETLNIGLKEGQDFSNPAAVPANGVIVNRSFIEKVHADEPVGKTLDTYLEDSLPGRIVGVTDDFHYQSMHSKIKPVILFMDNETDFNYGYVSIDPENLSAGVNAVRTVFRTLAPNTPFVYSFLDDRVAAQYDMESRWNSMVQYATIFSVIIAGSGLFAMTLLIAVQRTKEIAVRKILGASLPGIITLLQKDFIGLVVIANIIAWPGAYFLMSKVLENYAYNITIDASIFIASGMAALLLAVGIITVHAVRSANTNPVESLRYE